MQALQLSRILHTSKRMHFIEEYNISHVVGLSNHLHTSKRMHFIEDLHHRRMRSHAWDLAYVKTYALH